MLTRGPGRWNRPDVAEAWAQSFRMFREALLDPVFEAAGILVGVPGAGKTTWADKHDRAGVVLFDAVWANPARRRSMAGRIRAAGKDAIAVWVRTPLSVCLDRNALRPAWRRVPEPFCRDAAIKLRRNKVVKAEGWSTIVRVEHEI